MIESQSCFGMMTSSCWHILPAIIGLCRTFRDTFCQIDEGTIMEYRRASFLSARGPHVCWHSKQAVFRYSSCRHSRCARLVIQANIRARWCIDIKYGAKMDAVALLSEWVQNIGSQAGLSDNVQILSGAVGVPESRLEVKPRAYAAMITEDSKSSSVLACSVHRSSMGLMPQDPLTCSK